MAIFTAEVTEVLIAESSWNFDLTPGYQIQIVDPQPVVGDLPPTTTLQIESGCGVPVPHVGDIGLFFQAGRSNVVVPYRYYT